MHDDPSRCDQRIERIVRILHRLYRPEAIRLEEAEAFGVSTRTLRRDMELIGTLLPLERRRGVWRIDLPALGHRENDLDHALLQAFAENARIRAACLDRHSRDPQIVELAVRYHQLPRKRGETLLHAILHDRRCRFDYRDKEGTLTHRSVAPVKLLSDRGSWYLIAWDIDKEAQRNFRLERIRNLKITDEARGLDTDLLHALESVRDPWSDIHAEVQPILLHADSYATPYLKDMPLHPSQQLEEPHSDGGALFSYRVTHMMELIPRIKSWIPHLRILEPEEWHIHLSDELKGYLDGSK